jgi:hypothetical protein
MASQPPVPGAAHQWLAVLRPRQARQSLLPCSRIAPAAAVVTAPAPDGAAMQVEFGDDWRAVPEPGGSTSRRVLAARRGGCARCQGYCFTAPNAAAARKARQRKHRDYVRLRAAGKAPPPLKESPSRYAQRRAREDRAEHRVAVLQGRVMPDGERLFREHHERNEPRRLPPLYEC